MGIKEYIYKPSMDVRNIAKLDRFCVEQTLKAFILFSRPFLWVLEYLSLTHNAYYQNQTTVSLSNIFFLRGPKQVVSITEHVETIPLPCLPETQRYDQH